MSSKHESDVLVAGAGPVGLFTALNLARRGLRVHVFEEEWRETARSYALALHPGSLSLLAAEGLADAVLARAHHVDTIAFYEGRERRKEVRLSALSGPYPFVAVLPQHDLEALLVERLEKAHEVDVGWNHRVARFASRPDGVTAEVETLDKVSVGYAVATTEWVVDKVDRESARYLVGADGHRSTVRQLLDLDWEKVGEPELFALVEFDADVQVPRNELRVVLHQGTTSVLWPLPGGRWRWTLQLADRDDAQVWRHKSRVSVQLGRQSFGHFAEGAVPPLLATRAPWFSGEPKEVEWSMVVRFERRLASAFGRDRAWLAGDAAHLAPPVAVHSMNMGLFEAHDLAERLARVIGGGGGPELLQAYDREHRAAWRGLMALDPMAAALPATGAELEELRKQLR